jgi:hypothetical protein
LASSAASSAAAPPAAAPAETAAPPVETEASLGIPSAMAYYKQVNNPFIWYLKKMISYLSSSLAFHGLDKGVKTRGFGLNTNGGKEFLDLVSSRVLVTTSNKKKVSCEMLHFVIIFFEKEKEREKKN